MEGVPVCERDRMHGPALEVVFPANLRPGERSIASECRDVIS